VSALITQARYLVAFAAPTLERFGGAQGLSALAQAFMDRTEHRVRRDVGGVGKIVDVRRFTLAARVGGEREAEAFGRAGLVGSLIPLDLTISVGSSGSAKVTEVVEAIMGEPGFPHRAVRVELAAGGTSPLELAAFRRPALVEPRAG
jgi:hypothetical protein